MSTKKLLIREEENNPTAATRVSESPLFCERATGRA